jgi:PPOX class probable F420-dependent enzyme
MRDLTPAEARAFLADGKRTGKLATVRADGSPDVVPVWFVPAGAQLVFTCMSTSVKARNLARDPRAALSVDDEAFPYTFVTVRGTVEIAVRPDDHGAWTERIAARYVDDPVTTGARIAELDDWLVRLTPVSLLARAEVAVA